MSGQLLIAEPGALDETHLRIRLNLGFGVDAGRSVEELRFVDQRTFGSLGSFWRLGGGSFGNCCSRIRSRTSRPTRSRASADQEGDRPTHPCRHTEIKRVLLDQSVISVSTTSADSPLWRAELHGERVTDRITRAKLTPNSSALRHRRDGEAIAVGAPSTTYVSAINGQSGYFEQCIMAARAIRADSCGTPSCSTMS